MTIRTGVRRRAHIDLSVIRSTVAALATPLPDCAADLRADAYGHGLIPVARTLTDAGVGGFVVSRVEDAAAFVNQKFRAIVTEANAREKNLVVSRRELLEQERAEMREKFLLLTKACDRAAMARLFERLQNIESERKLDWIKVEAAKKSSKPRLRAAASGRGARKRKKK